MMIFPLHSPEPLHAPRVAIYPSQARRHTDFHSNISPLHTWILLNIRLAQQLQAVQAANPTIQEDVQPAKSHSSKRTQETCDPNLQDRWLLITVYHPSNSPGYCTSHAKRQSVQVPVIPKYWITSVLQKSHQKHPMHMKQSSKERKAGGGGRRYIRKTLCGWTQVILDVYYGFLNSESEGEKPAFHKSSSQKPL